MREPLFRVRYDAAALVRAHPPRFGHPHKTALFEMACAGPRGLAGEVEVTRWAGPPVEPLDLSAPLEIDVRPGFYDYVPYGDPASCAEWHVNFADPQLFVAYGSGLLAQDEMQVAEHPVLASVREALLTEGREAETRGAGSATPILVRGAERRIEVATDPDPAAGRPRGLYGALFAAAPIEVVRRAVRRIDPPTVSNIIAMAAPYGGRGAYDAGEIAGILSTALSGFTAARDESLRADGPACGAIVHSGFWGCGAFGGNRHLMIALQVLAARAAGASAMVLHAGPGSGVDDARAGVGIAADLAGACGPSCALGELAGRCAGLGLRWGVSDGN